MNEEIQNTWKPRREMVMRFAGGNACVVQKPGPELGMKTAHLHRRLRTLLRVSHDGQGRPLDELTDEQKDEVAAEWLEKQTDEQKALNYEIMRITVAACVKRPRIYVNPKPGQVGVDDVDEAEFWKVWNWYTDGCPDLQDADEGVSAADADRFPVEQAGGDGVGGSGCDVRAEAERVDEAA